MSREADTELDVDPGEEAVGTTTGRVERWRMHRRAVLVGVDGSLDSLRAVSWAAGCARRLAARLLIVQAGGARHNVLATASAEALRVAPLLEVRTLRAWSDPVPALRRLSWTADLLVLGRRGRGGLRCAPVGSTASLLLRYSRCPVVAIPRGREWDMSAPVVVGLDGSRDSRAALALGLGEAARRGVGLSVVHTCIDDRLDESAVEDWREKDWERATRKGGALIDRMVGQARAAIPGVRVDQLLMLEEPSRTLLDRAERAQLVVLGARGRGGFAGLPAGATATALFSFAPCPVIVVRPARRVLRRARADRRRRGSAQPQQEAVGDPG